MAEGMQGVNGTAMIILKLAFVLEEWVKLAFFLTTGYKIIYKTRLDFSNLIEPLIVF